jgi:phospholipid-transporting ATPase
VLDVCSRVCRGASLQNTEYIVGVCVYNGHTTKLFLNSSDPPHKVSQVEKVMNHQMYIIFGILFATCLFCAVYLGVLSSLYADTLVYLRLDASAFTGSAAVGTAIKNFFAFLVIFSFMVRD